MKQRHMVTSIVLLLGISIMISSNFREMALSGTTPGAVSTSVVSVYFERNHGQAAVPVRYLARAGDSTLLLTPDGATLQPMAMTMRLVGANSSPAIEGEQELPGRSNYFVGNDPGRWRTDIPHYARVRYREVYRGVDLVFYGNPGQVEYDFIVAAGADPGQIRLEFGGVERLQLDGDGNLHLRGSHGEVVQQAPLTYQEVGGTRQPIAGEYTLLAANQVGFRVGEYDRSLPLVLDPVMEYGRFFGGSKEDEVLSLAVDRAGNAYLTGETSSPDLPVTTGALPHKPAAFQTEGNTLAFVAKVDATGRLIYCTYLGGSKTAVGHNIKIDAQGNAYIGGRTEANDFPLKNPIQATFGGGSDDGFLAKLNAQGNALVYSTYIGGSEYDQGRALAVDGQGNAYLTGITESPNFPTKNPIQTKFGGKQDTFALKVNAAGTALVYSTYLGGSENDVGHAITVDGGGNAYITGLSNSSNFPTAKAVQSAFKGGEGNDVIVVKVNPAGTALAYSTYLGGRKNEESRGIVVDAAGNATVTGYTQSADYPTAKPLQTKFGGGSNDIFVSQFTPDGAALAFSTFLGGTGGDYGRGIALDAGRNVYLTGYTDSKDFVTKNPFHAAYAGGTADSIAVKLNSSGSAVLFSSFLGGSAYERGRGIAVDPAGNVYVSGRTESRDFPTTQSLNNKFGGGPNDGYLVKLTGQ